MLALEIPGLHGVYRLEGSDPAPDSLLTTSDEMLGFRYNILPESLKTFMEALNPKPRKPEKHPHRSNVFLVVRPSKIIFLI